MTVFEQQNLTNLRRYGYVQITNPEAAKMLYHFIVKNFNFEFHAGLKLLIGIGFYGTDNYILHAVPNIVKIFKTDIQNRLKIHQDQVKNFSAALDTLR